MAESTWWTRWGAWLLGWTIFWVIIAGAVAAFLIAFIGAMNEQYDRQIAWETSCEGRGGVVVPQYRAPTWCMIDGEIDSVWEN